MSVAVVTDLPIGEVATSTAVNATATSFQNATAAGALGANNVRLEGVDRRTLSPTGHVVFTTETGTNTPVVVAPVSLVHNATGIYAVVPGPLQTGSMTIATTTRVILHCSLYMESLTFLAGTSLRVTLILQQSADAGVSWSDLTGTLQRFQMRNTGAYCNQAGTTDIPGISTMATWSVTVVATGNPVLYRCAFQTLNDSTTGGVDIRFDTGTIFVETLGA